MRGAPLVRGSFGLLTIAALIATGRSQDAPPPSPKPGPEHMHLKSMEGAWDAIVTTHQDGKKAKAEATYKMECGGLWLVSDFQGEFEGAKFQGKGLDGYDPAKKKYVGVWVDSMITSPMLIEGTYDASTKTTTQTGEAPGPDGKPMKMKLVTKMPDNNHQTFEMYMIGADG